MDARKSRVALTAALVVASASLSALCGCATLRNGTAATLEVTSDPPGASVTIPGTAVSATTPAVVTVHRRTRPVDVHLDLEGHESVVKPVQRSIDPMVVNNLLIGGVLGAVLGRLVGDLPSNAQGLIGGAIIGVAADFFLGSAYLLSPTRVHATLPPQIPVEPNDPSP